MDFSHRKDSVKLGEKWKKGVPIEVLPFTYKVVQKKIQSLLGGQANLRMAQQKAVGTSTMFSCFLCFLFLYVYHSAVTDLICDLGSLQFHVKQHQ